MEILVSFADLNDVDVVAIVTENLGQSGLANLLQLRLREYAFLLVPEEFDHREWPNQNLSPSRSRLN